jgi:hypothetical protein
VAGNGQFGRLAKSAGFRRNPQQHAGTGAIGQEKTPTENGWGFVIGGGNDDLPQNSLKARALRNSLIINDEVILHNNFPTTRPEKRFSPPISQHRTRVTGLQ